MKNQSNSKEEVDIQKMYGHECLLSKEDFMQKYNINETGLTQSEPDEKIQKYGLNKISQNKPKRWYTYLLESLFSPFNCILLCIVIVLFYTDVYLASTPSYANIIVILILVTASTLLEFFEEYNSNKAAEKLKQLVEIRSLFYVQNRKNMLEYLHENE